MYINKDRPNENQHRFGIVRSHTPPPALGRDSDRKAVRDLYNQKRGASLVAQWLRIHLPMQGTRVQALIQEDPTYRGATKPVRHNY